MTYLKKFREDHFRPGLFAFSVVLSSVMLIAANWQWTRYHEKLALVDSFKSNLGSESLKMEPIDLEQSNVSRLIGKKVKVVGKFDFENQVIVTNRRTKYGAGSWLLTPFTLKGSNIAVMVSRGFIPYEDRLELNWRKYDLPNAANEMDIQGVVTKSTGKRSLLSPKATTSSEKGFLYPDLELISKVVPYPISNYVFIHGILDPVVGEYPLTDIKIDVPPSTHFWYTFEWIGLAIGTQVICFLVQLFRPRKINSIIIMVLFFLINFISPNNCLATPNPETVVQKAGIIERLNEPIDLNLVFEKDDGSQTTLKEFFLSKKPVIIAPVYFECPRLCTLTQTGLLKSIVENDLNIGTDYNVLSISFNDKETSKQSSKRAEVYREKFPENMQDKKLAWSFLTGKKESTEKLMTELGFKYEYDQGEFMHAAGIVILTPEGVISRYLYGIEYSRKDFKLALVEAAQGKIGSFMNQALMFCFRYDHIKGQYTLAIWKIIRIVCSVFVIFILAYVILLKFKENKTE